MNVVAGCLVMLILCFLSIIVVYDLRSMSIGSCSCVEGKAWLSTTNCTKDMGSVVQIGANRVLVMDLIVRPGFSDSRYKVIKVK